MSKNYTKIILFFGCYVDYSIVLFIRKTLLTARIDGDARIYVTVRAIDVLVGGNQYASITLHKPVVANQAARHFCVAITGPS